LNIDKLLKEKSGIKLDIGCGANKRPDWVGIDIQPFPGVDIVHDLLDFPYPLPDECVSVAMCSHVLEHIPKTAIIQERGKLKTINPFIMLMNEIWRVMKPDGQFAIAVPHGASPGFMQDPTHASQLNENTWAYFDPLMHNGLLWSFYKGFVKPWKIKTGGDGEPLLYFDPSNNMEVVLIKRRMDVSYE
jgi:SAM-dependent methyltransferase